MIEQKYTLHTHTHGFDGCSSPAEMINQAKSQGFEAIGISNHLIIHPEIFFTNFYPVAVARGYDGIYNYNFRDAINKFVPHYSKLERIANSKADIKVLRGLEVDFFPSTEWEKDFKRTIKILQPDYIIGAVHFVEYKGKLCNIHDIARAEPKDQDAMLKKYWKKLGDAAESGLFTWLAHPDLPKKLNLGTSYLDWHAYELGAAERILKSGTMVEFNTSIKDNRMITTNLRDKNIPVIISDDAHRAYQIGRDFNMADSEIGKAGNTIASLDKILYTTKKILENVGKRR